MPGIARQHPLQQGEHGGLIGAKAGQVLVQLAAALAEPEASLPHPQPQPLPSPEQRRVRVSVTALDRLRSDPYQFYANAILRLRELDALDAEPTPA